MVDQAPAPLVWAAGAALRRSEVRPLTLVILLRQNNLNIRLATPHPRDRALSPQLLDTAILREVNLLNTFTEVTKALVCRDILQDTDLALERAVVSITLASGTSLGRGQRLVTTRGHSHMEASL